LGRHAPWAYSPMWRAASRPVAGGMDRSEIGNRSAGDKSDRLRAVAGTSKSGGFWFIAVGERSARQRGGREPGDIRAQSISERVRSSVCSRMAGRARCRGAHRPFQCPRRQPEPAAELSRGSVSGPAPIVSDKLPRFPYSGRQQSRPRDYRQVCGKDPHQPLTRLRSMMM
jgi:hypothetical protein